VSEEEPCLDRNKLAVWCRIRKNISSMRSGKKSTIRQLLERTIVMIVMIVMICQLLQHAMIEQMPFSPLDKKAHTLAFDSQSDTDQRVNEPGNS
jgi:hypothetical protein